MGATLGRVDVGFESVFWGMQGGTPSLRGVEGARICPFASWHLRVHHLGPYAQVMNVYRQVLNLREQGQELFVTKMQTCPSSSL